MDQQLLQFIDARYYQLTSFAAYVVSCGRHKPLVGQTQQLLIVLSATDVMWLMWHIISVDKMSG